MKPRVAGARPRSVEAWLEAAGHFVRKVLSLEVKFHQGGFAVLAAEPGRIDGCGHDYQGRQKQKSAHGTLKA
jgi:hypothetical protein